MCLLIYIFVRGQFITFSKIIKLIYYRENAVPLPIRPGKWDSDALYKSK